MVSGDTVKVQNMVHFSKDADVLVHEALNPRMVEMIAAAYRAGAAERAVTAYVLAGREVCC